MKNQKFVLNLHLEENEELMNEIDALIRERAKAIVREEAEKMLGGAIQEEAKRVAKQKLADMKSYDFRNVMQGAIRHHLSWDDEMKVVIRAAVKEHMRDSTYTINNYIKDTIFAKLGGSIQTDVIKAITDALTKK